MALNISPISCSMCCYETAAKTSMSMLLAWPAAARSQVVLSCVSFFFAPMRIPVRIGTMTLERNIFPPKWCVGSKVVIIISHRLEINQAKLGGDFHLVKLDWDVPLPFLWLWEITKSDSKTVCQLWPFVITMCWDGTWPQNFFHK